MKLNLPRRLSQLALAAAVALSGASAALADTVWTKASPTANPFKREGVRIQSVENGELVFKVVSSDRQDRKPLAEVWQIKLDNDAALSAAEEAFATEKWDAAASGYQKVLDASRVEWIRYRATMRLMDSAAKLGNFNTTARAYAELVKLDPTAAARNKPKIPDGQKGKLDGAVAEVRRVSAGSGVSAEGQTLLKAVLLELARANGDEALQKQIAGQLTESSDAPRAGDDRSRADLRIQVALTALSAKEYDKALKEITNGAATFTEPEQQVDALYCRGEARAGLAKDATAMKDAALDFMRAVSIAKAAGIKSERVPQSLLRTAQLLEQIKADEEALALYQQLGEEYKDDGVAAQATEGAERVAAAVKADAEKQ